MLQAKATIQELLELDAAHIWHPYTQAKIAPQPLFVKSSKNEFIHVQDANGKEKKLIDGISSWWVNIHGHNNTYINSKIKEQLDLNEHVIFAGFTHEPAIRLIEELLPLLPQADFSSQFEDSRKLCKAFFSDNGSTAVEVGIKMALQYWYNQGNSKRKRICALKDSYHGDTIGTMSSSNTPIFHQAFKSILFPVSFVDSPAPQIKEPALEGLEDIKHKQAKLQARETESEATQRALDSFRAIIDKYPGEVAAIVVEPLVQGAGGMKFYSPKFLQELRKICNEHKIFLIADEVFTGFGRTGYDFACKQAMIVPDIICLSKGLTGGYLPMGLTVTNEDVYSAFHSDSKLKTFFHGHSFTGNPISCTAALASIELYKNEKRLKDVSYINKKMQSLDHYSLWALDIVRDIRIMGGIAVIELRDDMGEAYLHDIGQVLTRKFLERHILLRPLGNTLYFLPPYTISDESLDYCLSSIKAVLEEIS